MLTIDIADNKNNSTYNNYYYHNDSDYSKNDKSYIRTTESLCTNSWCRNKVVVIVVYIVAVVEEGSKMFGL